MENTKLRPELLEVVQKVAENNGIKHHKITSVQTNAKGEGFLGEIFLVSLKDTEAPDQQLNVVIKAAFQDDAIRTVMPMLRMTFENEVFFYTKVVPALKEFVQEHGDKLDDLVPKCYDVSLEDHGEYLVLENIKIKGFNTPPKTICFNDDHVRLIFHTYGKFHGQSFAFSGQNPDAARELGSKLQNVYDEFTNAVGFEENSRQLSNLILTHLESISYNADLIEKFRKFAKGSFCNMLSEAAHVIDYACIVHGDCWSNNLMFKYEEKDTGKTKPIAIRLLDWQLLNFGSPTCDLSYCLYSGGSKKIYDDLDKYLRIYYDSFSDTVRELGSDPEKMYPFTVLKEQWRKCSKLGLIMAMSIWCIKLTKTEDIKDMTDWKDVDVDTMDLNNLVFDREKYLKNMEEVIVHMYEIGAL